MLAGGVAAAAAGRLMGPTGGGIKIRRDHWSPETGALVRLFGGGSGDDGGLTGWRRWGGHRWCCVQLLLIGGMHHREWLFQQALQISA